MALMRALLLMLVALLVFAASASGHKAGWKVKQNVRAGDTLSGTFRWTTTKTTGTKIASVSFRVDGTQRCLDTTSPWSCRLDTRTLANGRHTFSVLATARDGHTTGDSDVATVRNASSPPPPPPPPPPPGECTAVASAGSDLSTFIGSLRSGDVGCLRGGEYRDGCEVDWTLDAADRATLQSYPGELAILHSSLGLQGDNLTARRLRIAGIASSCGDDSPGFTVGGANDVIEFSSVYGVTQHGILTHTNSSNTTIHGNFIESVGSECNLDHGIYFQRSGRITRNVIKDTRCGYGIHLYEGPSNVVVAQNTSVGSRVRGGILINCSSDCRIVNNIFAQNATEGITYRACSSGCVVDNNIAWENDLGAVGDSLAHLATRTMNLSPLFADAEYRVTALSPAVDAARTDFSFFPDRDGVPTTVGLLPDLGAYER